MTKDTVALLSAAIARELTHVEIELVEGSLAKFKQLRKLHSSNRIPRQDLKRTLLSIASQSPEKAAISLENCDDNTLAEIEQSLWYECGLMDVDKVLNPPNDLIPVAAGLALQRLSQSAAPGGAPTKGYQILFVKCCVNLWRDFGGTSTALWRNDITDDLSPLLTWTVSLFAALEGRRFDWGKAWELLDDELKAGKVSTL